MRTVCGRNHEVDTGGFSPKFTACDGIAVRGSHNSFRRAMIPTCIPQPKRRVMCKVFAIKSEGRSGMQRLQRIAAPKFMTTWSEETESIANFTKGPDFCSFGRRSALGRLWLRKGQCVGGEEYRNDSTVARDNSAARTTEESRALKEIEELLVAAIRSDSLSIQRNGAKEESMEELRGAMWRIEESFTIHAAGVWRR
ncbi:hypothetical protein FNV43_RR17313 [Rhamnella rubrinervis]|uniref:Uncharacterized protein n=1 Tax=Rhamnella rubrinervis TaxID=2594499 RepID=A0A8K0E2Y3_9ROSA|nr:hypothetical protein FNV43_RR17313 [Rhamnella rubrinervis]